MADSLFFEAEGRADASYGDNLPPSACFDSAQASCAYRECTRTIVELGAVDGAIRNKKRILHCRFAQPL